MDLAQKKLGHTQNGVLQVCDAPGIASWEHPAADRFRAPFGLRVRGLGCVRHLGFVLDRDPLRFGCLGGGGGGHSVVDLFPEPIT